ncbi:MAG: YlxR family protein [Erysipelotrichaceae bacterium]|uniref:RNase P modulator RnpM n=1 Tax=Anaerorhabdus sp. TaxID=1872524 RepID=UPI002FCC117E
MKKIPMRKCVATQDRYPKKELIRIVKTPEQTVCLDPSGKMNGRGAYLKKSSEALEIAIKRKALARALDIDIPQSIYDELKVMFEHE